MATKKKDLETLRSNYEASRKAFEEAENERINEFAKMIFSDDSIREKVLSMKTSTLKANAKMWIENLKKLSANTSQ